MFTHMNKFLRSSMCHIRPGKELGTALGLCPVQGIQRVGIYLLTGDLGDTEPRYLPFETFSLW